MSAVAWTALIVGNEGEIICVYLEGGNLYILNIVLVQGVSHQK